MAWAVDLLDLRPTTPVATVATGHHSNTARWNGGDGEHGPLLEELLLLEELQLLQLLLLLCFIYLATRVDTALSHPVHTTCRRGRPPTSSRTRLCGSSSDRTRGGPRASPRTGKAICKLPPAVCATSCPVLA